jgi:alkylresorcinol/alkylpyrone synthase
MRIASVASAFPQNYYTQEQISAALLREWKGQLPHPGVMERLHQRVGVDGRYFAVPIERYPEIRTWGQANDLWIEVGMQLGEESIRTALATAGLRTDSVRALITVSVTGIASPSLDARLVDKMALPRNTRRTPIFGLGCVAGAAGLTQATDYVRAYPDRVALLLSVELCSLTWQRDDLSVANLIASGLFGDGAAAVVVVGADVAPGSPASVPWGPRVLDTQSSFYPGTEDVMGWAVSEKGFSLVLSPEVPDVIHKNLPGDVDGLLAKHGLHRTDIGSWVLHTGGPKVLQAMSDSLGLPAEASEASWNNLRQVGNLSSTSVLLVLKDVMENRRPAAGTLGILAAMGPGFCSELLLLEW